MAQPAVQLYTLRDFVKTGADFRRSLEKIAAIGYPAVQLSAVEAMAGATPEVSAAEARKWLDDLGLRCIATHRSWDELLQNTDAEIEFHKTLGCDYTAIGGLPAAYQGQGAQGYAQWARDAAPLTAKLKAAGIQFGYHDHAFEFERVAADYSTGSQNIRTFYDVLIEEGGPDLMLEIDTYWIAHAGVNPERIVERCGGRLPVVHVKDKEVVGNDPVMAPVGEGNLDWDHLLPSLVQAGTEWLTVEQDTCRRDPFDCLRSSYEFLNGHAALK